MLGYGELERFYEGLVSQSRDRGIACAITSGMACVAFGVAGTTKDCDLLCAPKATGTFFELLQHTRFHGKGPEYRGHLTAPLDARWMGGGWTSHFVWRTEVGEAYLDVFGIAPRASTPWEAELEGAYANPHTVAEMKRTNRPRDWPFATALGIKLLAAGDARGWLHLFNYEVLIETYRKLPCPDSIVAQRPALELLASSDDRFELALKGEVEFWERLDQLRLKVYERAVRPYLLAVRGDGRSNSMSLALQHEARLERAQDLLPINPLRDYGISRLIDEAKAKASRMLPSGALAWLPDAAECFKFLPQ